MKKEINKYNRLLKESDNRIDWQDYYDEEEFWAIDENLDVEFVNVEFVNVGTFSDDIKKAKEIAKEIAKDLSGEVYTVEKSQYTYIEV